MLDLTKYRAQLLELKHCWQGQNVLFIIMHVPAVTDALLEEFFSRAHDICLSYQIQREGNRKGAAHG